MKRVRGFTIVEVLLFLGVSAILLSGLLVGTGANLARERYNDGVAGVEEFLVEQYMLVQNPERLSDGTKNRACVAYNAAGNRVNKVDGSPDPNNPNVTYLGTAEAPGQYRGRSDCLIYGRLIEFHTDSTGGQQISASTVVGRDLEAYAIANDDLNYRTWLLSATDEQLIDETRIGRADDTALFSPVWGVSAAGYTRPNGNPTLQNPAQGGILIMRMPISGSVRTFIIENGDTRNIRALRDFARSANSTANRYFCVLPDSGGIFSPLRKVIRIQQNLGNISAVSVLPTDTAADDEGQLIPCRQ